MGRTWRMEPCLMRTINRGIALVLCACVLLTLMPLSVALAGGPSSITPSATKVYVQFTSDTEIFTTAEYSPGKIIGAGTVLQLVANQTYESGGEEYYCLYYSNQPYNVRAGDVSGNILSAGDLSDYITNVLWNAGSFTSLKKEQGHKGDVRVHGLQLALKVLGYYSGNLDGNFGSGTESAVKAFQRANKLEVDGRAGPITQALLYPMALAGGGAGAGTGTETGSPASSTGTLKTTDSVNLRKGASTSTARLAVVPRSTTLSYFNTKVASGVTWYQVVYNNLTGWLMGTFVNAGGSSGGGSGGSGSITQIGTVTITKPGTRVRLAPDGNKSGIVLAKGSVVPLLADRVQAGGYGWYKIKTSSGVVGYVRDDCASASLDSGSGGGGGGSVPVPSSVKSYVRASGSLAIFTAKEKPSSGLTMIADGTVLQLVSPTPYTSGGSQYCSLYYNNKVYNAEYSDIQPNILTVQELTQYLTETIWKSSYTYSLKLESNLVGDVRVHAAQLALSILGYYTGALDGNYGGGTASAVRNFQRKYKLDVDGSIGPKTWNKLFPVAVAAYTGTGGGGDSGGGTVVTDFGTVKSVEKASWSTVDGGSVSLFGKGSKVTVMDVQTQKVFTVYRWSGGSHADCVPYSASDTKIMCDIVGFPYNSKAPSSSQLSQIKADTANNNATYTWPDFNNTWGGAKDIGSAWDRRPALLNVNGRVFCVSIYGWPHGFNGTDSFSKSKFPNGSLFYAQNNYYGMMCIHFVGSKTHGGSTVDSGHQAAIETAYNFAKTQWPKLVK